MLVKEPRTARSGAQCQCRNVPQAKRRHARKRKALSGHGPRIIERGRLLGRTYFGGWSSLLIQPAALDLSGSDTSISSSVCAHFRHLNVRCSKPSGPSETAAVIIRVWQVGQRGRWIGKSSGSGFFQLPIAAKNNAGFEYLSVRSPTHVQKFVTPQSNAMPTRFSLRQTTWQSGCEPSATSMKCSGIPAKLVTSSIRFELSLKCSNADLPNLRSWADMSRGLNKFREPNGGRVEAQLFEVFVR